MQEGHGDASPDGAALWAERLGTHRAHRCGLTAPRLCTVLLLLSMLCLRYQASLSHYGSHAQRTWRLFLEHGAKLDVAARRRSRVSGTCIPWGTIPAAKTGPDPSGRSDSQALQILYCDKHGGQKGWCRWVWGSPVRLVWAFMVPDCGQALGQFSRELSWQASHQLRTPGQYLLMSPW